MLDLLSPDTLHHLIHTYGLWVLFAVVMCESMGVPMPGETALVSAALYAGATHRIEILHVVTIAAGGAIVGDNIGYLIGRSVGLKLLIKHGSRIGLDEGRLKVGQYLFLKHGGKIVFFGRFVAFLRAFAAVLAGANRMAWPHFLIMNAAGGICWALLFGGGAYFFGERIKAVAGPVSLLLLLVVVVGLIAGIWFFRHHEKELEARARAALPD
ncbi:DedA family protein [Mesorhizobium sp. YR577]|uniref:DedA family protein n=1 Tax=Mesorhizobium sp. YR577 TaxID=1884373 RepID=UPI0008E60645|nr:DedA family protein [Mesorhizobium sp. YR577]SFT99287.1 membrane protein DedA, SNARE-associated domain [Mesorhizobium sp. YR577]